MLTMRQRGKAKNYYIRGSVTLGNRSIDVAEFSSGTSDKEAAAFLMAEHEPELREQLMFGKKATAAKATIADALSAYLGKSPAPHASDVLRVGKINELIGDLPLLDPKEAWRTLRTGYLARHAPAGQDRYRAVLQAAINVYNDEKDLQAVKLKPISFNNNRVRFLSHADRDKLIASYVPHVRPIATLLAFQGPRTQEALQLQWGAGGLDMLAGTIFFDRTKSGELRTVKMHPRVEEVIRPLWKKAGRPEKGHVFLNMHGDPYQDTRDAKIPGGNPLRSAHKTACKRAGISKFTVHDWRHHWASHCVMAGIDLPTIMRMGGWKELRMLQRYAAVDTTHMDAAVAKLT